MTPTAILVYYKTMANSIDMSFRIEGKFPLRKISKCFVIFYSLASATFIQDWQFCVSAFFLNLLDYFFKYIFLIKIVLVPGGGLEFRLKCF